MGDVELRIKSAYELPILNHPVNVYTFKKNYNEYKQKYMENRRNVVLLQPMGILCAVSFIFHNQ